MRRHHNIETIHLGAQLHVGRDKKGDKWDIRRWCDRGPMTWEATHRETKRLVYAGTLEEMSKKLLEQEGT